MSIYLILVDIHDLKLGFLFCQCRVSVRMWNSNFTWNLYVSLGETRIVWGEVRARDTTRYYSRLPDCKITACLITGMQSRRTTLLAILSLGPMLVFLVTAAAFFFLFSFCSYPLRLNNERLFHLQRRVFYVSNYRSLHPD